MNFKLLSFTALVALASSVAARDDRKLVSHYETTTWCEDIDWTRQCEFAVPPGGSVLNSICRNGDFGGRNAHNTSTVLCAIGNLDIPGQLTLLTGFVTSMAGANPIGGGAPVDAC